MARVLSEHDKDEDEASAHLKRLVLEEVRRRNDVAHGEWHIGYWSTTGGTVGSKPHSPSLMRIKPDRKEGVLADIDQHLDEHSDALERLRKMLWDYGTACFLPMDLRVRDVLRLEGKRGKQRTLVRVRDETTQP